MAALGFALARGLQPAAGPQTHRGRTRAGADRSSTVNTGGCRQALNDSLKWPQTTVRRAVAKVQLTVSHAWDSTFLVRQQQFDKFFTERHPNI